VRGAKLHYSTKEKGHTEGTERVSIQIDKS
jgi:hypothetical protein